MKRSWFYWLALVLLISLHFWFPSMNDDAGPGTYSTTAEGKKAFFLIADELMSPRMIRSNDPIDKLTRQMDYADAESSILCLLGPARWPNEQEWEAVMNWVQRGGKLLIACPERNPELVLPELKLRVVSDRQVRDWVSSPLMSAREIEDVYWYSEGTIEPGPFSFAHPLIDDAGNHQAVYTRYGNGEVILVASDFVFTNEALADEEAKNGVMAYRILERAMRGSSTNVRRIYFDESLNDSGAPKIVGVLLQRPLRPITIQLLIGLVLFAWWQSQRFGPLLPESTMTRHNIVDHTDTVGTLQFKTQNGRNVLRSYLKQLIAELKLKRYKGREEKVLSPLAARMNMAPEELKGVFVRATKLAREEYVPRKVAAQMIQQLSHIRQAARPSR